MGDDVQQRAARDDYRPLVRHVCGVTSETALVSAAIQALNEIDRLRGEVKRLKSAELPHLFGHDGGREIHPALDRRQAQTNRVAEVIRRALHHPLRPHDEHDIAAALAAAGLLADPDTARPDLPPDTPGVKPRTIDEARIGMVHELHEAVFGSTWARPEAPVDVWNMLLGKVRDTARLRRLGEAAIDLLRYMTDTEDGNCSLDHHGYCQEHPGGFRWLDGQDRPECWVAAAKKIVEEAGVEQ